MKVKYLGETSPLELINDKVYEVLSIEGEWYRIVDETDEDYLYPHYSQRWPLGTSPSCRVFNNAMSLISLTL